MSKYLCSHFYNNNPNITDWLVVIAAFSAAIFAFLAWRQAWGIHKEEKASKRAYLAPNSDPGYIKTTTELGEPPFISISIENYGTNPSNNIKTELLTYNQADLDGTNKNPLAIIKSTLYTYNPIPGGATLKLFITGDSDVPKLKLLASHYFVLRIKYYDIVLQKSYSDIFLWKIGPNMKLY